MTYDRTKPFRARYEFNPKFAGFLVCLASAFLTCWLIYKAGQWAFG
jgi:hypothetical protein